MLIEQIDHVPSESLQRSFSNFFDVLWPTIDTHLLAFRTNFESELRSDHHLLTHRSERFAHKFFVRERSVNFSGIEERDAKFNRLAKQRDHLLLIFRRTVPKAHSHTAQPDGRDFQATLSKFALLHFSELLTLILDLQLRSEERRVGKECRSRWS